MLTVTKPWEYVMPDANRLMLKLAALAAGIELMPGMHPTRMFLATNGCDWNPLKNLGDALRLAIKLEINVKPNAVISAQWRDWATLDMKEVREERVEDREAATCRAIVRAAAEIAKGLRDMPEAEEIRKLVDPIHGGEGYSREFTQGAA